MLKYSHFGFGIYGKFNYTCIVKLKYIMKINQLKYTEQEIKNFSEYYKLGRSLKEISEHFNVNYHTLKQNLIRFGYRTPMKKLNNQRVTKITYFDTIDTHEKTYFLGLLFADGYISKTPYGVNIGIALQLQDKYILEYLKKELNVSNKISDYKNSSKFSITCQHTYNKLINLGIKENKSHLDYKIPHIDKKFVNSFILRYFDGDGCITIKTTGYSVVSICCNSKVFLEDVQQYLESMDIVTRPIAIEKRTNNNLFVLYLSKRENQLKFMNLIYKNSNIFLQRKYHKFLQIPS